MTLIEEVMALISYKQEGSYWDFKKQWYGKDKRSDLLHDIICMANNLSNRDAYIIIGVDEEVDFNFVDVSSDVNRKNTQKMVDFLREKRFAGGIRPVVFVQELKIKGKMIDVIVIKNSNSAPYFLTERFEEVCPNNIYIRVADTNTPINSTADINNIEHLWKKRFGIDKTPIEQLKQFLSEHDSWVSEPGPNSQKEYHTLRPEYTIELIPDDITGYEFYIFGQFDITPHWGNAIVMYHQTILVYCLMVHIDCGVCTVPAPDRDWISFDEKTECQYSFCFYLKDSIKHLIYLHYYKAETFEESNAHDRYMKCILTFNSESEKNSFKDFVEENEEIFRSIEIPATSLPYFPEIQDLRVKSYKNEYMTALKLKEMFKRWSNLRAK